MDLLLICRAETKAVARGLIEGHRAWPLTDAGRRQALLLGERLAWERRVSTLFTSSLEEARETAGLVGQATGLSPETDPDLGEVDSC